MSGSHGHKAIPKMTVGRYAGTPIDQLPNSYLRWIIGQDFSQEILDAAFHKLKQSDYNDTYLSVSRHAIDMFSKRFLNMWIASQAGIENGDGLATFLVKQAEVAWAKGRDVSKHRYEGDGIVKEWGGVRYVFEMNKNFPDYKNVITVMSAD